jgi:hypothetical protein
MRLVTHVAYDNMHCRLLKNHSGKVLSSAHLAGGHQDVGASRNCDISNDDVFCGLPVNDPDRGGESEDLLSDCHRHRTLRQHLRTIQTVTSGYLERALKNERGTGTARPKTLYQEFKSSQLSNIKKRLKQLILLACPSKIRS